MTQTIKIYAFLYFTFLNVDISYSQVSSPASVAFRPMTVNQVEVPSPMPVRTLPSYQPPVGMTAESVQKQVNENAMRNMGYQPPPIPPTDPTARHQFITAQARQNKQNKQLQQLAEIRAILQEDLPDLQNLAELERIDLTRSYREAFIELRKIKNGEIPLSIKRAVFLVENAWYDNTLSYEDFQKQIAIKVGAINMLAKKEKISSGNLGKNYLIQKLFSERIVEYKGDVVYRVHKPFQYDFEDFLAENDWSKMFVTKLLKTGVGQCHSLPLLYLIFAEEIGAESWLSLAPEHSFIVFRDDATKTFYNFETTNGNAVSTDWLMESGYITTQAIRNRVYLDTLGNTGLLSTLMSDLIMGYTNKFGYDDFVVSMVDTLVQMNPRSLQAQMFKADLLVLRTKSILQKAGNPSIERIQEFPEANASYLALLAQYDLIEELGYMQMPKTEYESWLASLSSAKRTQEKQKLKTDIITNAKKTN